jgi:hypothetical protein
MKDSSAFTFQEAESKEEAVAIIRYDKNNVSLCLSLKTGGDLEVVMSKEDAHKLILALSKCINVE